MEIKAEKLKKWTLLWCKYIMAYNIIFLLKFIINALGVESSFPSVFRPSNNIRSVHFLPLPCIPTQLTVFVEFFSFGEPVHSVHTQVALQMP